MNPFCEAILKLCTVFLCMKELLLTAQRTSNRYIYAGQRGSGDFIQGCILPSTNP